MRPMRPMRPMLPILSILMMLLLGGWESSCFGDPGTGVETPPPTLIANGSYLGPVSGVIEATGDTLRGTLTMHFTVSGGAGTFALNGGWTDSDSIVPVSIAGTAGYGEVQVLGLFFYLNIPSCGQLAKAMAAPEGVYNTATHHVLITGGYIDILSSNCTVLREFQLLPSEILPQ